MENYKICNGCHNCHFVKKTLYVEGVKYLCNNSDNWESDYLPATANYYGLFVDEKRLAVDWITKHSVDAVGTCDDWKEELPEDKLNFSNFNK
jgi:hypothetical protein